ncbi:MAG: hydrogenase nickel incorporation protein HypB [Firmicutes bacterium]|nr:hydrogenase nickel incorporation protein HypB [Bacillota bacterium]
MGEVRIIEVKESITARNDEAAEEIRSSLTSKGTLFVNIMSAPGSGKTTLIGALIKRLGRDWKIGEMDVDIETSLDAQKIKDATGVEALQIHNMGLCHIDADMVKRALKEYDTEGLDLLILENIGNLVCPAEFDTGAHKRIMLISVPEGDDKPLKYPLMFSVSDLVIISKTDALGYFDFDFEACEQRVKALNPSAEFIRLSVKTGEGLDEVCAWFEREIRKVKGI